MTAENFLSTVSNVADGVAGDGRRKWVCHTDSDRRVTRVSYRLAQGTHALEHRLIDQMYAAVQAHGATLPRACIVDYYISLKTTSFVVLTEGATHSKSALTQGVAEAIVGARSSQYVQITGGASWPQGTGEGRYYRSVLERFDSLRFLEVLHEAASPGNAGKAYFLYLGGLHPDEVNHFFSNLLRWKSDGEKRLALPGLSPEQQPVVPPNVYITANVQSDVVYPLSQQALRYANSVYVPATIGVEPVASAQRIPIPPVGYQRIMLESAIHDVETARYKLAAILGDVQLSSLSPSPALMRIIWRGGLVLGGRTLRELTRYVANSFDAYGQGLFDRNDAQHNAQVALDIHAVRRVIASLSDTQNSSLRRDLEEYQAMLLAETVVSC